MKPFRLVFVVSLLAIGEILLVAFFDQNWYASIVLAIPMMVVAVLMGYMSGRSLWHDVGDWSQRKIRRLSALIEILVFPTMSLPLLYFGFGEALHLAFHLDQSLMNMFPIVGFLFFLLIGFGYWSRPPESSNP